MVPWSVQCYCQWVPGPGFALWVFSVLTSGEWNLDCFLPIRMDLSATSWYPLIYTYFQTPPEQSLPTLIIWIFQVKYGFGLIAQVNYKCYFFLFCQYESLSVRKYTKYLTIWVWERTDWCFLLLAVARKRTTKHSWQQNCCKFPNLEPCLSRKEWLLSKTGHDNELDTLVEHC